MSKKLIYLCCFILAPGLTGGVVIAEPLQQDPGPDGIVSVEAENFDANVEVGGHAWVETGPTGGFTGTAGMWAPNGQGGGGSNYAANSERLEYEINFVKTGMHYVWILAWGASGTDDSCHAGLDGEATPLSSQMSGWNDNYEWNNGRYQAPGPSRIEITSTGLHTLNIWVREDGLIIDKIVLTTNPDFTLSSNEEGPPESRRGPILNAHNPSPTEGELYEDIWANLSWSAGATAVSHDVYVGENFADVNEGTGDTFRGNQPSTFFVVGFPGFAYPDGLVPGTTYYWRVDEVEADGTTKHEGPVWSFRVPPRNAYEPSPLDGAVYQDTDMPLTWSPGLGAKLHTVYFGDTFDDVNSDVAAGSPRPTADYIPASPLEHDKTYYWRVDELNPPTTVKGEVWSFTTLPEILITDPNLVGWWKFEANKGTRIVDWSGHGNHGTISGAANVQWVSSLFNLGLEFLGDYQGYVELPPGMVTTGKGSILMWINTTQGNDEGMLWYGTAVTYGNGYGGENEIHINIDDPGAGEVDFFLEEDGSGSDITINGPEVGGQGWTHVAATWDLADGCRLYVNGLQVGSEPHNTNVQDLAVIRLGSAAEDDVFYEGIMDDVRLFDRALSADEVVEIFSKGEDPRRPGSPQPGNSSLVTLIEATPLSWSPGEGASEHDVYFGTDRDAVAGADASDTTGIYRGRHSVTTHTPAEGVEWAGGPYYWRIDEIAGDGTITEGGIWSFTVADYLIVDDFESYNDIVFGEPGSNLIYETWKDGFDNPTVNGSAAGYVEAFQPTMESGIVHGGGQSAPLLYNNGTAALSEITANTSDLPVGRNWTIGSPQTLVLWFHGSPANSVSDRLYVKINGAKVTYPGNAADVAAVRWKQWNIDLATLGTNLTNVTQVTIGLERAGAVGGAGTVLIDDIRLYRTAPQVVVPSEEVWIEAEAAASISAPMKVYDDPLASAGKYIGTDVGIGNESDTPPADGVATYSFTVQGGIYKVTGRVIIPSGDSFWVRIPGATNLTPGEDPDNPGTGWVRWSDPPDSEAWYWEDVFSADHAGETANWTLAAGTYTLEIARREDGALLDVILISKID